MMAVGEPAESARVEAAHLKHHHTFYTLHPTPYIGTYGGLRGGYVSYERSTPVSIIDTRNMRIKLCAVTFDNFGCFIPQP